MSLFCLCPRSEDGGRTEGTAPWAAADCPLSPSARPHTFTPTEKGRVRKLKSVTYVLTRYPHKDCKSALRVLRQLASCWRCLKYCSMMQKSCSSDDHLQTDGRVRPDLFVIISQSVWGVNNTQWPNIYFRCCTVFASLQQETRGLHGLEQRLVLFLSVPSAGAITNVQTQKRCCVYTGVKCFYFFIL